MITSQTTGGIRQKNWRWRPDIPRRMATCKASIRLELETDAHPTINGHTTWLQLESSKRRSMYFIYKLEIGLLTNYHCLLALGSAASFIRYCLCSFVPMLPPPPSPRLSQPPNLTTRAVALSASFEFTSVAKETRS